MDDRAVQFLEVMIGLVVVGAAAFLVLLINNAVRPAVQNGAGQRRNSAGFAEPQAAPPRWYGFFLAAILLVVVAVVMAWQLVPWENFGTDRAEAGGDWRAAMKPQVFFWLMLVVAAIGVLIFVIAVFVHWTRQSALPATGPSQVTDASASAISPPDDIAQESSGVGRFIGLLILAIAFLILNWTYLPPDIEYALMLYGLYPASLALALVLLFDKASRRWQAKSGADSFREWLFCDGFVFLLVLSYLNLMASKAGEAYAAQFWDFAGIFLFFIVFWVTDRTQVRFRFLLAYLALIAAPLLLLIWQTVQAVETPPDISWWRTIWPFFGLAIIGFVLEIITLVATDKDSRSVVPALKDTLFHIVYAVLLLIAIPEAAA